MPQTKGNPVVYLVGGIAIVVLVVFGIARLAPPLSDRQAAEQKPPTYSRNICDDSFKTDEDHSRENPASIEITLKEHCFSGFITLPDAWNNWQRQFIGNDQTDWESHWYAGMADPHGPFSWAIEMSQTHQDFYVPKKMRLQGKGKLVFYRTSP